MLFRDTAPGANFGTLGAVPLDAPERDRATTRLVCDRVSFATGNGLCLHPEAGFFGLFTSYSAILLDNTLKPRGVPITLEDRPSLTRVAPDGHVGANTMFIIGDDYGASFSTRTTLVDLRSGDQIGDLEQFITWRDGERVRAQDFNFFGATFARDGNVFYASLLTGGATYLVRGDLASRRLTVLRENVECPSLSPNNREIALKKACWA
ncbi:MAG: hypothetical protein EXQ55_04305 [Acidobacteria bacterium]|nr:hypothetical protein [Acidobacteriota bacterium]